MKLFYQLILLVDSQIAQHKHRCLWITSLETLSKIYRIGLHKRLLSIRLGHVGDTYREEGIK
jgi:hypothetical protein